MEKSEKQIIETKEMKIKKMDLLITEYQQWLIEEKILKEKKKEIEEKLFNFLSQRGILHKKARILIQESKNAPKYKDLSIHLMAKYMGKSASENFLTDLEKNQIEVEKEESKKIVEKIASSWEISHPKTTKKVLNIDKK